MDIRAWITRKILDYLTEPLPDYQRFVWNDPQALRRHIRKGDVLLIDGDNRVSQIIKYLTQSCWSHAVLYVGDELLRRGGEAADRAREAFGDDAEELLVEALPHGVVASPLSKYIDYNIRIARPHRLAPDHLKLIVEDALAAIGWRYDLRNVLDLARYLIPVHVVPNVLRRTALHFGSGQPTEVICSSLLGRLFAKVRFPILPQIEYPDAFDAADPTAQPPDPAAPHLRLRERRLHGHLPHAPPDAADAARLRPLAVLRDHQVQRGGRRTLRLPAHPVGRAAGGGRVPSSLRRAPAAEAAGRLEPCERAFPHQGHAGVDRAQPGSVVGHGGDPRGADRAAQQLEPA